MSEERKYVLVEQTPDSEDFDEALTELEMLKMLEDKLRPTDLDKIRAAMISAEVQFTLDAPPSDYKTMVFSVVAGGSELHMGFGPGGELRYMEIIA